MDPLIVSLVISPPPHIARDLSLSLSLDKTNRGLFSLSLRLLRVRERDQGEYTGGGVVVIKQELVRLRKVIFVSCIRIIL